MRNRTALVAVLLALLALPLLAAAQDRLARFEGGIGVVPVRLAGTTAVPNTVRGTNPGGQPWVITRLSADVRADGRISVDGRGLLLGGGDAIGTTNNVSVRARFFCGLVGFDSAAAVPLEANGDFRIEGELVGTPPAACANPVLLIISTGGNWFAAGIPKL